LQVRELEGQGFKRMNASAVRYPTPRVTITEIPQQEMATILHSLPGWTEVASPLPGQEPLQQIELRKLFEFHSFQEAIEFMREVSESVVKVEHHPRWENIWRTVTIGLSTWDIGHKPSQLDVDLAREIERIHKRYVGKAKRPRKPGHSRAIP
jgi:pterin-4a-carbinolamine dehydratase